MNAVKFRLLGLFIIAALIIISLPFLEDKDTATQKMAVSVPPFPDEAVQVDAEPGTVALPTDGHVLHDGTSANQRIRKKGYIKPTIINQSAQDLFAVEDNTSTDHANEQLAQLDTLPRVSAKKIESLAKTVIKPVQLKNAAWVIQIGSFNDKANALRLVNQLRNNGYSAFIQQVSTAFGAHTRVLVGPVNQQEAAKQMASKLENQLHIKGIVINYKPLEL